MYYLRRLAADSQRWSPRKELLETLKDVRRALNCTSLAKEFDSSEQLELLHNFRSSADTPSPKSSIEWTVPDDIVERRDRVAELLADVGLDVALWSALHSTRSQRNSPEPKPSEMLPDYECMRHGDRVIVRAPDHVQNCSNGRIGAFRYYSDPRIGHDQRQAAVHLDGETEDTLDYFPPEYLQFAPEEEHRGRYWHLDGYETEYESWEEMQNAYRHHRALVLKYTQAERTHRVTLAAGRDADLHIYTDGRAVYVLAINSCLGYVGVEVFRDGEREKEFFFQEHNVENKLGYDFWNLNFTEMLERILDGCFFGNEPPSREQEQEFDRYQHLGTWSRYGFTLQLYDTEQVDRLGKSVLAYELFDENYEGDPVFQRADFHCSPLHHPASDATVADLLGFLSQRPRQTNSERFADYTAEQCRWCEERSADLALVAEEYGQRHGWRELHEAGLTEEAVLAVARHGRTEDIFEVLDLDIFNSYDVVEKMNKDQDDPALYSMLRELHYLRNVEIVGGEDELRNYYE